MAQSTKKKKRKKQKIRVRRTILLLLLLAAAGTAFCLFAPFFHIQEIAVTGNSKVSTEEIIQRAQIPAEYNLFRLDTGQVAQNIAQIPYIDTVQVSRKLPNRVAVTVTESTPAFLAAYGQEWLLLDQQGKVLEAVASTEGYDLPVMTGLTIQSAVPASPIGIDDPQKFDIIISNCRQLVDAGLLPQIREVDASDILEFTVTLKSGLRVMFGKADNMDYKLAMLEKVLPQVDQMEGAYLDLRVPEKAFYGEEETPSPSPSADPGASQAPDASDSPGEDEGADAEVEQTQEQENQEDEVTKDA